MKTRLKRYEKSQDGQFKRISSELVTFVRITGEKSAIVKDKNGKEKTVRRSSLLDVPQSILYPDIPVINKEHEDWRKYNYFD